MLANHAAWAIDQGHVLDVLRAIPDESVHCVVTSPPYFGLRFYGTDAQVWGGDPSCSHEYAPSAVAPVGIPGNRLGDLSTSSLSNPARQNGVPRSAWQGVIKPTANGMTNSTMSGETMNNHEATATRRALHSSECGVCGAWRGELGSEPTPELFVGHLVAIFREVRRVLRADGTCWINIGDSYAGAGRGPTGWNGIGDQVRRQGFTGGTGTNKQGPSLGRVDGLKKKDLCLVPERLAIALQDDGWFIRSRIAWCKAVPMPEAVLDRPTVAWEHLWLCTKAGKYYFDAAAVRVPGSAAQDLRNQQYARPYPVFDANADDKQPGNANSVGIHARPGPGGHNLWSYWLLSPEPFPEARFATFPTELPRRCIAAGTSERGVCPACAAPWRRIAERDSVPMSNAGKRGTVIAGKGTSNGQDRADHDVRDGLTSSVVTLGWEPTCRCGAGDAIPAVVLDPFAGSGTSVMVATRLGRRGIGIELNPEYADMARKRVTNDAPLFNTVPS